MLSSYVLVQRVFKELAHTETLFRKSDVWFQVHYPFSNLPHFPFTLPLLYSFLNDNGIGFPSSLPFSYKDLEFEYVMMIGSHADPLQQVLNGVLWIVWNWVKKCSSFWKVSHWFLHEAVIHTMWKTNKSIGFLPHNPLCQFSGLHGSNQSLPWLLISWTTFSTGESCGWGILLFICLLPDFRFTTVHSSISMTSLVTSGWFVFWPHWFFFLLSKFGGDLEVILVQVWLSYFIHEV